MGLFTTNDASVYRRWVNVIPSILISGGGHFLAGRRRAATIWFSITLSVAFIQFFLLISPLNKSYTLYQTFAYFRLAVLAVMLVESCRKPIPRLKIKAWLAYVFVAIAIIAVPFLTIRQFLFHPFKIPTGAMQPTLMGNTRTPDSIEETGDNIIVSKMAYWFHEPQRGDIVVFSTSGIQYSSVPPNTFYVKRIVGIPGDTVSIHAPNVLVNAKILDDPPVFKKIISGSNGYSGYTNLGLLATDEDRIILGKNEYLVFGDNSQNSLDGRFFGAIKRSSIIGKVILITWPFERKGKPE